ncbi:MAG: 4a-hydroxytetrahydrobiopterin dehydratase [Candidatus Pacearchaeota archaeon]
MENKNLSQKKCGPCENGQKPMETSEIMEHSGQTPNWDVVEDKKLHKHYDFKNFKEVREFTKKVCDLADEEGHHPDICFSFNYVDVSIMTHSIGGLSENDFILASKIDRIDSPQPKENSEK